MTVKITRDDLMKLTTYVRKRSEEYNLIIKKDGTFSSEGYTLSMKKLSKLLIQDVKKNNVVSLKDRDLSRLIVMAVKGTKKRTLSGEPGGWKRMSEELTK